MYLYEMYIPKIIFRRIFMEKYVSYSKKAKYYNGNGDTFPTIGEKYTCQIENLDSKEIEDKETDPIEHITKLGGNLYQLITRNAVYFITINK